MIYKNLLALLAQGRGGLLKCITLPTHEDNVLTQWADKCERAYLGHDYYNGYGGGGI
jgi:hypothetical protein